MKKLLAFSLPLFFILPLSASLMEPPKYAKGNQDLWITYRDFKKIAPPRGDLRICSIDDLCLDETKTFEQLGLIQRSDGYSINANNSFVAEIHPDSDGKEQTRWFSSKPVNGIEVSEIIMYINKKFPKQSIHINTGCHGRKNGQTAFDNRNLAETRFLKQDMYIIWEMDNVSFQQVCSYNPSVYPRGANHVIDAWCYSKITTYRKTIDTYIKNPLLSSGLNLQGVCKNVYCPAINQKMWARKGLGNFFLGKEIHHCQCPICDETLKSVKEFRVYNCKYHFDAMKKNMKKKIDIQGNHDMKKDINVNFFSKNKEKIEDYFFFQIDTVSF